MATAARSARATPLKHDSAMWWLFAPCSVSIWSVSPALPAKAWKNSRTSWVSKAPIFSVGNSALKTRNGRPGGVDGHPCERLVHRQQAVGVAREPSLVAKRLGQRLAKRDADVLDGVVIVDVAVAFRADADVDQGVARELVQHMVEEADARRNVGRARSVEIEADLDARLFRLACDDALAHGYIRHPCPLCPVDPARLIARPGPLGHQNSVWRVFPPLLYRK